jgi:hypothetical protein
LLKKPKPSRSPLRGQLTAEVRLSASVLRQAGCQLAGLTQEDGGQHQRHLRRLPTSEPLAHSLMRHTHTGANDRQRLASSPPRSKPRYKFKASEHVSNCTKAGSQAGDRTNDAYSNWLLNILIR